MLLLCFAVCSPLYVLFFVFVLFCIMMYYVSVIFHSLLFCFFRLSFVLCFVDVEFLLQNWIMLYFSSLFLLYVSALFVFICFPLCVWLKIVLCFVFSLCVCYVWYVDLFLLCFLLCFHLVLPSCSCLICILLNSDLFSSMILLGFCFYVLWQHQVCSSIGQALEFANSVGFSAGKSAISVPSLEEAFCPSCQHN